MLQHGVALRLFRWIYVDYECDVCLLFSVGPRQYKRMSVYFFSRSLRSFTQSFIKTAIKVSLCRVGFCLSVFAPILGGGQGIFLVIA